MGEGFWHLRHQFPLARVEKEEKKRRNDKNWKSTSELMPADNIIDTPLQMITFCFNFAAKKGFVSYFAFLPEVENEFARAQKRGANRSLQDVKKSSFPSSVI